MIVVTVPKPLSEAICLHCGQEPVMILKDGTPAAGLCGDCFFDALMDKMASDFGWELNGKGTATNRQAKKAKKK
jgi:hypothetical protein